MPFRKKPFAPETHLKWLRIMSLFVGVISTVWFMIGGIIDVRQLFKDLAARVNDPLDDGWVEGHVSLADKDNFVKKDNGTSNYDE